MRIGPTTLVRRASAMQADPDPAEGHLRLDGGSCALREYSSLKQLASCPERACAHNGSAGVTLDQDFG